MRLLFAFLLGLIASGAMAQEVTLEVEDRLRVSASGQADVWIWSYPAGLDVEERGDTILVEGPAGKYRVNVKGLSIDWENRQFSQVNGSIEITLGPPDPGPGPTPPGPGPGPSPDLDDPVSEAAYKSALELSLGEQAPAVAKIYREAGERLLGVQEPILRTIPESVDFVKSSYASVEHDAERWKQWWSPLDAKWDASVEDRQQAGDFLISVAKGLEAL